jgi:putative Holliday junction resolvase
LKLCENIVKKFFTKILENSGKLLGIDFGKKKIGIALSDDCQISARPLKTVPAKIAIEEIKKILTQNPDIVGLIVGLPKSKSGDAEKSVKEFAELLKSQTNLPVDFIDERLTSWEARELLKEQGLKDEKIKELEDQTAAMLILQNYLNFQSSKIHKEQDNS